MKTILALLGAAFLIVAAGSAQSFSIDWFTIDGGGGTSSGGAYSVTGTIGQPDAGISSGGSYSLIGGFWGAVIPLQQAGAPTLFVQGLEKGNVKVYWAPNTAGFVLQEAGTLNPTPVSWTNAPATYTNGAIIPASLQTRFFRLIKP